MLPPSATQSMWSVSGDARCSTTRGGRCITDGDGDYAHNMACTFEALQSLSVVTVHFSLERNYDYLYLGTRDVYRERWDGSRGPDWLLLEPGDSLYFDTDSSVSRSGFEVCAMDPDTPWPPRPPPNPRPPPPPSPSPPPAPFPPAAPLRLVDGATYMEGRLEIFHNGEWGTVCDDGFSTTEARAVCFTLFGSIDGDVIDVVEGSGRIWLDDVDCPTPSTPIEHCDHRDWGSNNCGHAEDVGVRCRMSPPASPSPPLSPPYPPYPPRPPASPPPPPPAFEALALLLVFFVAYCLSDLHAFLRSVVTRRANNTGTATAAAADVDVGAGCLGAYFGGACCGHEVITCRFVLPSGIGDGDFARSACVFYNDMDVTGDLTPVAPCCGGGESVITLRFRRVEGAVLTFFANPPARKEVRDKPQCIYERNRFFLRCESTNPDSPWNGLVLAQGPRLTHADVRCRSARRGRSGGPIYRWARAEYDDRGWAAPVAVGSWYRCPLPCVFFRQMHPLADPVGSLCMLPWALAALAISAIAPWFNPVLFGLCGAYGSGGGGVWLPNQQFDGGAVFRILVDATDEGRGLTGPPPRPDDTAGQEGGSANLSREPIALVPAAETEVLASTVAAIVTPMDLPRELNLYSVIHGPSSSPGPTHQRTPCAFCGGSGALDGWSIPDSLVCPLSGSLMREPVLLGGNSRVYERDLIEAWLSNHPMDSFLVGMGSTLVRKLYDAVEAGKALAEPYSIMKPSSSSTTSSSSSS
jgi:hypothetical protein